MVDKDGFVWLGGKGLEMMLLVKTWSNVRMMYYLLYKTLILHDRNNMTMISSYSKEDL